MTHDVLSSLTDIADSTVELTRLREAANDVLRRSWSLARFQSLLDGPGPVFDPDLWQTVSELGWPDVLVGAASGGGGGSLRELCVLAEAVGAAAAPVPLAAAAAAAWCDDRCHDGISLMLPGRGELSAGTVSGIWPVVPFGTVADTLVVCAGTGEQAVLGVVDPTSAGVERMPITPLDHNPAARISLQDVPIQVFEEGIAAESRCRDAALRAQVAQLAELVGTVSAANEAATEYAKLRIAFGRPIGTFQAIKHRLVDQRCVVEVGRALVNRAADACQHDHSDAAALVSLAAFWGIDRLRAVPEGVTQVFGGIAYTWEHEAHIHLRRAASSVATLGTRGFHRNVVARWLSARYPVTARREGSA